MSPYVSESSDFSYIPIVCFRQMSGGSRNERSYTVESGRRRSQYGYRSGPLTPEELKSIKDQMGTNWGASWRNIRLMEGSDVFHVHHPKRVWTVNDRTYSEVSMTPGRTSSTTTYTRGNPSSPIVQSRTTEGYVSVRGMKMPPPMPPPDSLRGIAGDIMRRVAPAKPAVNLTRFIGEQRDLPRLFQRSVYAPRSVREVASSYLAYIFGFRPTISDLQSIADTVIRMDPIVRNYVAHERMQLRRSATHILGSEAGGDTVLRRATTTNTSTTVSGVVTHLAFVTPGKASVFPQSEPWAQLSVNYSWTQGVRAFGTYTYFIPKPQFLDQRLSNAARSAQALFGGGLDAPTAWELIPWTWLTDWFVDVGGLLRYQQLVADNQMVATRQGFTTFERCTATASVTLVPDPSGPAPEISTNVAHSLYLSKKEERRSGSPYSMAANWELSPQQATILTALGLSRR